MTAVARVVLGLLGLLGLGGPFGPHPCWLPPVSGPLVEPFRAPACDFCAGHRGVLFAAVPGEPVRAVAAGVVTFAGSVASVAYVVVEHVDGVRATYGNLGGITVRSGERVPVGGAVGTAGPRVHFGLRRAGRYLDPAPWFAGAHARPRLVPVDGRHRRPSPAVRGCGP